MTFAEILPHLAAGKRVRRAAYPKGRWVEPRGNAPLIVQRAGDNGPIYATDVDFADLLASDWELRPEVGDRYVMEPHDEI